MRGGQHLVDGFEIIVTVVVLSVLIELPMVLDMLPEPARRGLLIAALLTPAIASIWKHLSGLDPELAGRPALRALAVTCLGYATLVGLVWTIGISGGDLINNLSTQVLNFLSVPIALLLIAAGSAARPTASRWRSAGRPAHSAEWDLAWGRCPDRSWPARAPGRSSPTHGSFGTRIGGSRLLPRRGASTTTEGRLPCAMCRGAPHALCRRHNSGCSRPPPRTSNDHISHELVADHRLA
jgi:hypothetical protein